MHHQYPLVQLGMCKQETVRYFVRQKEVVKRGWVRLLYSWYDAVFYSRWGYIGCVHIIWPWLGLYSVAGMVHTTLFCTFLFLGGLSHLRCMFTNPEQCRRMQCRCQKILITHDCMGKRQENANVVGSTSHQEPILTAVCNVMLSRWTTTAPG